MLLFLTKWRILGEEIWIYATTLSVNSPQPKSTRQIVEQSHRIGVQFLLTDMNAALTFLDVAEVSESTDVRARNRNHARTAYQTVLRLLPKISPSADERSALEQKLNTLRNRLRRLGCLVSDEVVDAPDPGVGI